MIFYLPTHLKERISERIDLVLLAMHIETQHLSDGFLNCAFQYLLLDI
jgi:hypothetical protein